MRYLKLYEANKTNKKIQLLKDLFVDIEDIGLDVNIYDGEKLTIKSVLGTAWKMKGDFWWADELPRIGSYLPSRIVPKDIIIIVVSKKTIFSKSDYYNITELEKTLSSFKIKISVKMVPVSGLNSTSDKNIIYIFNKSGYRINILKDY